MLVSRRAFIEGVLAGAAAAPLRSQTAEGSARIDVIVADPIGTIAPEIYGHFIEHLGGVFYDGVCVGEKSTVANTGGLRQSVIDALKGIHGPVIRWPGGCFPERYACRAGRGTGNGRKPR